MSPTPKRATLAVRSDAMFVSRHLRCGIEQQPSGHGCALQGQALLELGQLAAGAIAGLNQQHLGVAAAGFDEIVAHD